MTECPCKKKAWKVPTKEPEITNWKDVHVYDYTSFLNRIMLENLWDCDYTVRAINEYKKFMFLAKDFNVVPSKPVDIVWHTHLLYTRNYETMCFELGKSFIHHDPITITNYYGNKSKDTYESTLALYMVTFGEYPKDVWTDFKKEDKYASVNLRNNVIIPKQDLSKWSIIKILLKMLFNV